MARRIEAVDIAGPAGRLECLLEEPEDRDPHTAVLVCHPHPLYGGTMHNKVVYRIARALRRAGGRAAVQLPWSGAQRGRARLSRRRNRGCSDRGRVAARAVSELPYALAGFSFGSRVITRLGCATEGAAWLLACGFPTRLGAAEYLEGCAVRKIFIQSTTTSTVQAGNSRACTSASRSRNNSTGLQLATTSSPARWTSSRTLSPARLLCHPEPFMDIITGNVGWIEVICGPMFSGKSEELIRRLRRAMIARKRVEVFKPVIDDRYSDDEIVSHGDLRMKSQVVTGAAEITGGIDSRREVVGVDEANFMGEGWWKWRSGWPTAVSR